MLTKLIETGLDWLTATSANTEVQEAMQSLWEQIIDEREVHSKYIKKGSWQQYIGQTIPHGFIGSRDDGVLVRLSGDLAYDYATLFIDLGCRPSRVDVQATVRATIPPNEIINTLYHSARQHKPSIGRTPKLKMFTNREAVEGLYVGSRNSEVFLRTYDKYLESREEEYKDCVRFECELKSFAARAFADKASILPVDRLMYIDLLKTLYSQRGMDIPVDGSGSEVVLHKTSSQTGVESKMWWLSTQVAPTVRHLVEVLGYQVVYDVVFGDILDTGTNGVV